MDQTEREREEIARYIERGWGLDDRALNRWRSDEEIAKAKVEREEMDRERARVYAETQARAERELARGRERIETIRSSMTLAEAEDEARAWDAERAARQGQARLEAKRRWRARVVETVPARFQQADLLDFQDTAFRSAVASLVDRLAGWNGLTICGPTGVGKTHLAVALAVEWAQMHHSEQVLFSSVRDLIASVKAGYGEGSNVEVRYKAFSGLLVLDDLGSERGTDFALSLLEDLIGHRYDNVLPTLVVTNADLDKLPVEHYGRIVSRLLEMNGKPIVMRGRDRRRGAP